MTADTLVYALGGARGHAVRGLTLARRIRSQSRSADLLVTECGAQHLGRETGEEIQTDERWPEVQERIRSGAYKNLIVDTFARGWREELPLLLPYFEKRTFVARYNRVPFPAEHLSPYDQILAPYPENLDEWPEPLRGDTEWTGWLLRDDPLCPVADRTQGLTVLDPGKRLIPGFRQLIERLCKSRQVSVNYRSDLPAGTKVGKLLVIGAGYNTFYELLGSECDTMFVPLEKRWDDQPRRARMFGRSIESPEDLGDWLDVEADSVARRASIEEVKDGKRRDNS